MQAEAWEVPSGCLPKKEGKPKGLGPVAIVTVTLTVTGEEQSRAEPPLLREVTLLGSAVYSLPPTGLAIEA